MSVEVRDEFRWVEADRVGQIEELHNIDPPFSSLNPRDVVVSSNSIVTRFFV